MRKIEMLLSFDNSDLVAGVYPHPDRPDNDLYAMTVDISEYRRRIMYGIWCENDQKHSFPHREHGWPALISLSRSTKRGSEYVSVTYTHKAHWFVDRRAYRENGQPVSWERKVILRKCIKNQHNSDIDKSWQLVQVQTEWAWNNPLRVIGTKRYQDGQLQSSNMEFGYRSQPGNNGLIEWLREMGFKPQDYFHPECQMAVKLAFGK